MSLPILKKITSDEQRIAVVQAALSDNDNMTFPTHVVMKGDKIVGGWCLGGVPLVMCWHSTTEVNAKDSMILNNAVAGIMNDRGVGMYMMACNNESPYINYMERFGLKPVWPTNIFYMRTD